MTCPRLLRREWGAGLGSRPGRLEGPGEGFCSHLGSGSAGTGHLPAVPGAPGPELQGPARFPKRRSGPGAPADGPDPYLKKTQPGQRRSLGTRLGSMHDPPGAAGALSAGMEAPSRPCSAASLSFQGQRVLKCSRLYSEGPGDAGICFPPGSEGCPPCPANLTPEQAALSAHLCSQHEAG